MGSLAASVCTKWSPNPYQQRQSVIVQCLNCGGEWGDHRLRSFGPESPAPKVAVKFAQPNAAAPLTACELSPSASVHALRVIVRRVMEPVHSRTTLGFGVIEGTEVRVGPNATTEVTRYENTVVVIDAARVPSIATALGTVTGALAGVEVLVPPARVIIREPVYTLYPAVYVGDTVTVPGMKPTLVRGMGVVVVGPSDHDAVKDQTYRVRYDPTDVDIDAVQWGHGTVITDIPGHELVSNANWRHWETADQAGWLLKPTWVDGSIVPASPDPRQPARLTQP